MFSETSNELINISDPTRIDEYCDTGDVETYELD